MHLDKQQAVAPAQADRIDDDVQVAPGRDGILATAARGAQGGAALPYFDVVQQAFGRHDIRNIKASTNGAATAIGAHAYAYGDHVVFGRAPDLHLAAHEAAHVVQQRAGHAPAGGVSEPGDALERHADEVADAVVRGESAERILDKLAPGSSTGPAPALGVQMEIGIADGTEVVIDGIAGIHTVKSSLNRYNYVITFDTGEEKAVHFAKVHVANDTHREREKQRLLDRPPTTGMQCKCPLLAGDDVDAPFTIVEDHGDRLVVARGDRRFDAERWMILPLAYTPPPTVNSAREHTLITDEMCREVGELPAKMSTPGALRKDVRALKGKTLGPVTSLHVDFSETARVDVTSSCTDTGVQIGFRVTSNPSYMCERIYPLGHDKHGAGEVQDLVPLYLEFAPDSHPELITVVEPSDAENCCEGTVVYSWTALAQAIAIPGAAKLTASEARVAVLAKTKVLGVKAQWLAQVAGKNNQNHTSGGIRQKGGSGLVPLVEITSEDYLGTEDDKRITEWNMGERLHEGRETFDAFPGLMQEGKELATTLEAESEFRVDADQLEEVVTRMKGLCATPAYWERFGILKMTGSSPKEYVDTYYDIAGTEVNDRALLKHGVVLRERHVSSDPENTFLLAVKGASYAKPQRGVSQPDEHAERIRLAAQVNLDRTKVLSDEGRGSVPSEMGGRELDRLVTDTRIDNAFARTLDHALGGEQGPNGHAMTDLLGEQGHLRPALRIKSTRHKFLMSLAGGTAIDFSADAATGIELDPQTGAERPLDEPPVVHSFEFGVGHPSLTATSTPSTPSDGGVTVERPYHVPKDLENPMLFEKKDYKQFQKLRDDVIAQALSAKKETLEKGGNKAQVLARMLGMIA